MGKFNEHMIHELRREEEAKAKLPEEIFLSQELKRLEDTHPSPDKVIVIGGHCFTSILTKNYRGEDQWCWLYTPERTLKDTLL